MERYFTSDTHFYHKNILKFCRDTRDGEDAEEMTELMVDRWNELIKPYDIVYHTGDFSFGSIEKTRLILGRLNGQIHITTGNHDKGLEGLKPFFASFKVYNTIKIGEHRFALMHYPMESWDQMHRGTIHLHGHIHGDQHHECRIMKNRFDIGIDTRKDKKMVPYHFDEVMERIKEQNQILENTKYFDRLMELNA